jgi:hypothetical protein
MPMTIPGRVSRGVSTALALLATVGLVAAAAPGPAAAADEPAFCATRTLHDYLAPLKRMPKLRELPFRRKGEGRFRGVEIETSGPSLAVDGGSGGYLIQWDKNPGWYITVSLAQVRRDGSVGVDIGRANLRLATLAPIVSIEPHFALPDRPGFYRSTLVIRAPSGHKLARFGNYYRVIRPRIDMRLTTEAPSYRPGDEVFARLEDPGIAYALFGEESALEVLQGETWGPVPEVSPISTPLQSVGPGTTSAHCVAFTVPASAPAGRYRLAQETLISWPFEERERRPKLYAEFEVTGP